MASMVSRDCRCTCECEGGASGGDIRDLIGRDSWACCQSANDPPTAHSAFCSQLQRTADADERGLAHASPALYAAHTVKAGFPRGAMPRKRDWTPHTHM
jgi:hypothetical protein